MNNISEVRFVQRHIKINSNGGQIERVCINDICNALKRDAFIKDGTALRKCPSAAIIDQNRPGDFYALFSEVIRFIQWMCSDSKILAPLGRELLELLQKSSIANDDNASSQPASEAVDVVELEYSGNKFTMKMYDGRLMVNATQMARPFEKRPNVWLKTMEAVRLRQALVDDGVCRNLESQVFATRGPYGATWLEVHLWIHFAQWLSPAFASWCSKKIVPLMQEGNVKPAGDTTTEGQASQRPEHEDTDFTQETFLPVPETYENALVVIEHQKETIHKQREFIRQNKLKINHYEETIETRKWFTTTMIANELATSAIKLNWFLMEEGVLQKIDGQWTVNREYHHLRDYHIYEWYNSKTKYTNKYKIDSWTPQGREYILELWKKENG